MDRRVVFKTLDNPARVLFWDLDDFCLMAIPPFLGIAMGVLWLMFIGVLLRPFYARLKRRFPKGTFLHFAYWSLPKNAWDRAGRLGSLPPSHRRDYLT